MKNLNELDRYRVPLMGDMGNEYNGAFEVRINGIKFYVIASNGMGWEHVSVSLPNRVPSWEEMCKIKELFFKDDEVVMQLHPAKKDYINFHKYCLHLWRPLNEKIPLPNKIMV